MRFSLAGIPVHVTPVFWVVCAVLALGRIDAPLTLASWVAVVFVSVLLHELGHALAALAFRQKVEISLHGMGGTASYSGPPVNGLQRMLIALGGPFAGFGLGAAALVASPFAPAGLPAVVASDLVWANLGWGALNLLPIPPLDGSHALDAALSRVNDTVRTRIVQGTGFATAAVLAGLAIYGQAWLVVFLLGWLVVRQVMDRNQAKAWEEDKVHVDAAFDALNAQDWERALAPLEKLAHDAGTQRASSWAWQYLPQVYIALDRSEEVIEPLLERMGTDPKAADPLVLALTQLGRDDELFILLNDPACGPSAQALGFASHHAFEDRRFATAEQLSARAFEASGDGMHAFNAACAAARRGDIDGGLAWMERVLETEFVELQAWDQDEDIAALRADPRWVALRARGPA